MDDWMILQAGGDETDIERYALEHGADLSAEDVAMEEKNHQVKDEVVGAENGDGVCDHE